MFNDVNALWKEMRRLDLTIRQTALKMEAM